MALSRDAIEKTIPQAKLNSFSPEIESLRGIASLAVVLGHFYLLFFMPMWGFSATAPHATLLELFVSCIFDPQPAVLVFFTISGLVLGRQLRKEPIVDLRSFLAYLCRRAFRLIPLMWVTTVFAYFLVNSFNPLDPSILGQNLILQDINLNVPLWSLKVELYCSLVFPAIFLLSEFGGKLLNFIAFIAFALLSYYWHQPLYIQFLVFFHAGLLVDRLSNKATRFIPQRFSFVLLCLATMVLLLAPQLSLGTRNWGIGAWQSWVIPTIIACPLILLIVISQTKTYFNSFLRLAPIRYLGKISFSIYLIHFPLYFHMRIKYFHSSSLFGIASFVICYLAIVFILSSISYRWIEVPSNNLGKKLGSYLLKARRRAVLLPD